VADDESVIRNPESILDILRTACRRNELAILVTPYAKFESNFLRVDQDQFHVSANMSKEDAQFGLRSPELRIRFPHGHRILTGITSVAGISIANGRRSLKLTFPPTLENDDFRRAFRVERVGRVQVTFSSRHYQLLVGNLVNISTSGARVFSAKDLEADDVLPEDIIRVTIPLTPEIVINTPAKVRHVKDRTIGMEFWPSLDGLLLDQLSRWTFQKKEEALVLLAQPEPEERHEEIQAVPVAEPQIALVGAMVELENLLRPLLAGLPPLRRYPANIQSMRALAASPKTLVLFHADSANSDGFKRISLLLEPLQNKVPFVLLSTALDQGTVRKMAHDLKAALGCALGPDGNALFPKLIAGIFRMQIQDF